MRVATMMLIAMTSLVVPAVGQTVRGQSSTTTSGGQATSTVTARLSRARQPYTVEYSITRVQTLANGTTITHESSETEALDSQGRRVHATTFERESENRMHVSAFDPVARTHTSWEVPGKRATVMALPEPGAGHGCSMRADSGQERFSTEQGRLSAERVGDNRVVEKLGTATIENVEARGERITYTTPAGSQGNDAPLVRSEEIWRAIPAEWGHLVLRRINDDPRDGKSDKEVKSLTQGEPDPSLFQPPEGYEIVNKSAPETVCPSD